jgi:GDPmannose 4,6-dehydratase
VFAYWATVNYRESYGIFATNGILFNHESERRGETFVTRKITRGIARIKAGLDQKIYLGNIEARRDWGYAPEYMEAAWMMLQQPNPDDFVIGTGESHSVKDFLIAAFRTVGIEDWEKYIEIDPRYYRPAEVENLIADPTKAREILGWKPKITFDDLVRRMMQSDLKAYGLEG